MIVYHGTNSDMNGVTDFKLDRERHQDLNAYGPGIYLTDSIEEAQCYGNNIYKVDLSDLKIVDGDKKNNKLATEIFRSTNKELVMDLMMDFGYESFSTRAERYVLSQYLVQEDLVSVLVLFYHDLFRYDYKSYAECVRPFIDGYFIDKGTSKNYIVTSANRLKFELMV
jgi:hypothetical protein